MRSMYTALFMALALFSAGQELTVLTYNIRYDNQNDGKDRWELRKEPLVAEVLSHKPAIIGMQEVLRDQMAYLAAHLPGYGHFGVARDDGQASGEFAPVFYDTVRFALLDGRTVWLSPTPDKPGPGWDATCNRIVTFITLRDRSNGDSLWIANTHWDHEGREARRHSARIVHDLLAGPLARKGRVIFMGDLNAKDKEEPVRFLCGHLTDACPPKQDGCGTFNGFKQIRLCMPRIDYVLLAPGRWSVREYRVPRPKANGRQVSDHFPVVVSLQPAP